MPSALGDDVAAGVGAGLVVGDVPGGDELLHVAVVDGDPREPAVAQQVGARVADVDERPAARWSAVASRVGRRRRRGRVGLGRQTVTTTSAVIVVPMPCWSGLPMAAR